MAYADRINLPANLFIVVQYSRSRPVRKGRGVSKCNRIKEYIIRTKRESDEKSIGRLGDDVMERLSDRIAGPFFS